MPEPEFTALIRYLAAVPLATRCPSSEAVPALLYISVFN